MSRETSWKVVDSIPGCHFPIHPVSSVILRICKEWNHEKKRDYHMGVEPKIGGKPQNGWFIRENPIRIDDKNRVPLFLETPI